MEFVENFRGSYKAKVGIAVTEGNYGDEADRRKG